jgi:hypothetical protein
VSTLFLLAVPVILLTCLFAPVHWLLFLDVLLVLIPPDEVAQVGSVRFDHTDLIFAGILASLVFRGQRRPTLREVPYYWLWIVLGVLLSLSYLAAPVNQAFLTDPLRAGYQLYRYCWRPILYFPLAFLLLTGPARTRTFFLVMIIAGDLLSLYGIWQGYSPGGNVTGPFNKGNALGTALGGPLMASAGMFVLARSTRERFFVFLSILMIVRAIAFTGSRGTLVAVCSGVAVLLWGLSSLPSVRSRVLPIGALATLGVLWMALFNPLQAPSLQRLEVLRQGTGVSTFQWRVEHRWPHFFDLTMAHPLLGTGSSADLSLGTRGNTPHNGYLAVAARSGIPVLAIYLTFAVLALRSSARVLRRSTAPYEKVFGAIIAGGMTFMLVHNIVESSFLAPVGARTFFLFTALALTAERHRAPRRPSVRAPIPRLWSRGPARSPLTHRPGGARS